MKPFFPPNGIHTLCLGYSHSHTRPSHSEQFAGIYRFHMVDRLCGEWRSHATWKIHTHSIRSVNLLFLFRALFTRRTLSSSLLSFLRNLFFHCGFSVFFSSHIEMLLYWNKFMEHLFNSNLILFGVGILRCKWVLHEIQSCLQFKPHVTSN